MSNTDFDPQQPAPPQQPYFPPPPPSPLGQLLRQQQQPPIPQLPSMRIANAETPGVNFTGGRQDVQPRDAQTDLPLQQPMHVEQEPTVAPPPNIPRNRPFQRYIPAATRDDNWGSHSPQMIAGASNPALGQGPFMPSDREAIDVIRGAGRQLGQWGPPAVAQPMNWASQLAGVIGPVMDFYSKNAFSSHYRNQMLGGLAERRQALEEHREQFIMDRERMVDYARQAMGNHKAILEDYNDVFNRYKRHEITKEEAEQEIRNLNIQNNHSTMDATLNSKGLGGVENALKLEDAKFQDVMSSVISMDQARKRDPDKKKADDVADSWFSDGGATGRDLPTTPPGTPEAPETAAPAQAPLSDFDQQLAKNHPGPDGKTLTKDAITQAHDIYRNGKPSGLTDNQAGKLHPKAYNAVLGAAGEIGNAITDVANGEGTTEQKLNKISKIDPRTATEIQGLTSYQIDPKGLGAERRNLVGLAEAASNGKYKEGFYSIAQKYRDPNTKEGTVMQRTGTLPAAALAVLNALDPMSETSKIPENQLKKFAAEYWTGDDKYAQLYASLRMFATDAVAVSMGTGTPRVQLVNDLIRHMTAGGSPAQIRAQMQTDLRTAYAYIQNANQEWKSETGSATNAPGFQEENRQMLDAMMRMNPHTGQVPSDAPDALKAVGRPANAKKPSWLTPEQAKPPLTRAEVDDARTWLRDNPDDPRAQAIRRELGITP